MKIKFLANDRHVVVVWLGNRFEAEADLFRSHGFLMTYGATTDLHVRLRPASDWSGAAKWNTKIPSTHDRTVTRFFGFEPDKWTTSRERGAPSSPLSEASTTPVAWSSPENTQRSGVPGSEDRRLPATPRSLKTG